MYVDDGVRMHLIMSLVTLLGAWTGFSGYLHNKDRIEKTQWILRYQSFLSFVLIFVITSGIWFSYMSRPATSTFTDYLAQLAAADPTVRMQYELSSSAGGAPGIYKFLSFGLNGALVALGSVRAISRQIPGNRDKWTILFLYAVSAMIFKTIIALDRAGALLIFLVVGYDVVASGRLNRVRILALTGFAVIVFSALAAVRQQGLGPIEALLVYAAHGISNFGLVLNAPSCLDYGGNTFLAPLFFVISRLTGFDLLADCAINTWDWNPAHYFFSSLFLDFSYAGLVLCWLIGYAVVSLDIAAHRGKILALAANHQAVVAVITMIGVTTLRSIELYYAVAVAWVLLRIAVYREGTKEA